MDALQAILTRRSTRKYDSRMVEKEKIEQILEAGRYAPSGSNSQTTHFIVLTKEETLKDLKDLVQKAFAKMELKEDMYSSLKNSINAARNGNYTFHYNAPIFIVVANQKGYGNAMADSACALENMMVAANALDLGSCWINQLHWLDEDEDIRQYLYQKGLEENETITGSLIIGYPEDGMPERNALPRKGNIVTWEEDIQ